MRFSASGTAGMVVYAAIFYVLTKFGVWYVLSAVTAGLVQTAVKFTFYKYVVFQNNNPEFIARQMKQFFVAAVGFLVVNSSMLYVLVEYARMGKFTAQVLLIVLLTVGSFVLSKRIFAN